MRLQGGGGKDRISLLLLSCQAWDEDRVRVGGKHEAAGRRWKRHEISAHIELQEVGEKYRIWSIQLFANYRKSGHILSCLARIGHLVSKEDLDCSNENMIESLQTPGCDKEYETMPNKHLLLLNLLQEQVADVVCALHYAPIHFTYH
jgi:hypothetical protein